MSRVQGCDDGIAEALRCHPTPWRLDDDHGVVVDAAGNRIIILAVWDRTADSVAALIVHAVNEFDKRHQGP